MNFLVDDSSYGLLMKKPLFPIALLVGTLTSCTPYQAPTAATDRHTDAGMTDTHERQQAELPVSGDYPYAEKTSIPGQVISPYHPFNVMDVRGLRPGSLALDLSCQKKFRIP